MKKITHNGETTYINPKTTNHNLFRKYFKNFPEKDIFVIEKYFGKKMPREILKIIALTDDPNSILNIVGHEKRKLFYLKFFLPLRTRVVKLFDVNETPQLPLNKWMFGPYLYALTLDDFEVNNLRSNIRKKIHFLRILKNINHPEYRLKSFPNLSMLSLYSSRCVNVKNHDQIKYLEIYHGYRFNKIKDFPNLEILKLVNSMSTGLSKSNPAQKNLRKLYLINCPKMPKKVNYPNLNLLYVNNTPCTGSSSKKCKVIKRNV